jgi:CTP synthase (UTP-ammonia lyase)
MADAFTVRIALVGDYDPKVPAHRAIPAALQLSALRLGLEAAPSWLHTTSIGTAAASLGDFSGVWCVPASPYASADGALSAIRFCREARRPFLGTCGGFQHAVLEFVRNALGHAAAEHAETSPDAPMPLISRLSCSLVEQSARVVFCEGSRLRAIYGTPEAEESYRCNYGLNPRYESLLSESALRIAARDAAGDVRAVELASHPFFIATLYQPERSALAAREHPLITAFVSAGAARASAELDLGSAP